MTKDIPPAENRKRVRQNPRTYECTCPLYTSSLGKVTVFLPRKVFLHSISLRQESPYSEDICVLYFFRISAMGGNNRRKSTTNRSKSKQRSKAGGSSSGRVRNSLFVEGGLLSDWQPQQKQQHCCSSSRGLCFLFFYLLLFI